MTNGLYIPNFNCNLLSVSTLTKEYNCTITFMADSCIIQDLPSRTLIGKGMNRDGLYLLEPIQDRGIAMKVGKSVDANLWHSRIKHTLDTKIIGIESIHDVDNSQNKIPCDSCIRAKHTRLAFPLSSIKSSSCFDLMHCDIWG